MNSPLYHEIPKPSPDLSSTTACFFYLTYHTSPSNTAYLRPCTYMSLCDRNVVLQAVHHRAVAVLHHPEGHLVQPPLQGTLVHRLAPARGNTPVSVRVDAAMCLVKSSYLSP